MHAYVGGNGCSAAYWIATSCDRVTLDATALVGSIGTVVSFIKRPDNEGEKRFEFVSSQSPNKRLDIESEQGQTAIQKQLDAMADVFISRVARNMSVTKDKVKSDFGQGGVMIGQDAIEAGMAHELGNLEALISSLSSGKYSTQKKSNQNAINQNATHWLALDGTTPENILTAIKEQYPEALTMLERQVETLSPALALDMADEANLPMLTRKLSTMSEPDAIHLVKQAQTLRDVLAASGMQGAFTSMVNHLDDPARIIGMAIHETRAYIDEECDIDRAINAKESHNCSGYNQADIYAQRNAR
ncbi:S49 family peptidase [Aliivibrio salmonicida]|uniref:S49 family peptidase n=1 Tax=Aliivibrio salmonicida TaxID=40269 RepID=UPI00406C413A